MAVHVNLMSKFYLVPKVLAMTASRPTTSINIPITFKSIEAFTLQIWVKLSTLQTLPSNLLNIAGNFLLNSISTSTGGVTTYNYECKLALTTPSTWADMQLNPISGGWDLVSCSFTINPYHGRMTVNSAVYWDPSSNNLVSFPSLTQITIPVITAGSAACYSLKDLKLWSSYRSINQINDDVSYSHYNKLTPYLIAHVPFDTNCDSVNQQCDTNYLTLQGLPDNTFAQIKWQSKKPPYHIALTGSASQILELVAPSKLWYLARSEFSLQVFVLFIGSVSQDTCFLRVQNLLWLVLTSGNTVTGIIYNPIYMTNITITGGSIIPGSWNFIVLQKMPGTNMLLSINSVVYTGQAAVLITNKNI